MKTAIIIHSCKTSTLLASCSIRLPAENTSQSNGKASGQLPQQEANTVGTPAGKEASNVNLTLGTPSSDLADGSSPTSDHADGPTTTQQAESPPNAADAEAVSVKHLIQRQSSHVAVSVLHLNQSIKLQCSVGSQTRLIGHPGLNAHASGYPTQRLFAHVAMEVAQECCHNTVRQLCISLLVVLQISRC